jgi:uncharacterized membrane protein/protein-disulfide isomerase
MKKNTKLEIVLRTFLEAMKINPSSMSFAKSLNNHPDPYSLIAISDILNEKSIKNSTFLFPELERDKLLELPTPFISQTTEGGFIVVKKITDSFVEYYSSIIGEMKEDWSAFNTQCTGVALLAFPEESPIKQKLNFSALLEFIGKHFSKVLIFIFSFALIGIGFSFYNLFSNWALIGLLLCKSIGLIITIFLFLFEYKQTNSLVHDVCNATKTDCNKVLNDKNAKLFGVISWSDLGLIYFMGSLLTLLMNQGKIYDSLNALFLLNAPCLLFSFYSIWFQVYKAKEACIFCLSIIAIFWIEFFLFLSFFDFNFHFDFQHLTILPSLILGFTLPVSFIYVFKLLWEKHNDWDNLKVQLNGIKFNEKVIKTLREGQKERFAFDNQAFCIFGDKNAENSLTLVTNPGCGPCAKQHEKLEHYMNGCYEDLKINIIFSIGQFYNLPDSEIYKITKRIAAIYKHQGAKNTLNCLDDWYISNMPFEEFMAKYPVENENAADLLSSHYDWCEKNNIQYTPTILFNDRELPKHYEIEDIKYLMT